jgi:murein DD-endopeptidase MepM/ murein hydrolase activator NlpD
MRLRLLIAAVTVPLALWALLPLGAAGKPSLSSRIQEKRDQIAGKKSSERVLASSIAGYSSRIGSLQSDITRLTARQATIQADLDAKLARLAAIQRDLRAERARLARLRARLAEARVMLARRLVDLYKADNPDVLTVVLNSDGFADLLERSEFARRVGAQDRRIIRVVQTAKADATATAKRLARLEDEARAIAEAIERRRDEVVRVKDTLVDRRDAYAVVRARKQTVLSSVRADRHDLEGDLRALEAQQARITAQLQRSAANNGYDPSVAGPPRSGSGGLIWPVNGPIVSPFGQRWGRLHAGVDIAVPSGTPVRAPASGTVAIAGPVSGYGNYVCIQHGGPLSTCSAHNTSISVSVGQHVGQGQIIASSGCTGHCFGPHVHFETRINGAPVDPMGYL